jgi:hypothetical protein
MPKIDREMKNGATGMADDTTQRLLDAEAHRKSYNAIMKTGGQVAAPLCLALGMFFTNLVMRNGLITAVVVSVITFFVAYFIVKTFFSSH